MPIGGGAPLQVTNSGAPNFVFAFSPNDDELVFHAFEESIRNVYTVSLNDLQISPVATSDFNELFPSWSPDPDRVTYQSGGIYEATRQPDGRWVVADDPLIPQGRFAEWSPTADAIAYQRPDSLFVRDFEQDSVRLVTNISGYARIRWSKDGSRIYYIDQASERAARLWAVNASGGTPEPLLDFDTVTLGYPHFDVVGDEVYFNVKESRSNLLVIDLDGS